MTCENIGLCGGCTFRDLSYEEQITYKERKVKETLSKYFAANTEFQNIIKSPLIYAYRNKMEFSFGDDKKDGPLNLGMHQKRSFYNILNANNCDLISDETCKKYIENGRRLTNEGNYNEAINEFSKALEYNPVNVAVINKIVSCYKYLHNIEKEFEYAQKTYNFCCTRSELATYYRNVGWYYLEKYKPEVSVSCYMYFNLFEKSVQNEN